MTQFNPKMFKRLSKATFFGGLIICCSILLSAENESAYNYNPSPNQLSDYQQKKAEISEEIYHKICKTVQDMRQPPTFKFIYNHKGKPYYNAYYSPKNNTINFGEGIYDLARRFGKDSINVVATVMGHEIAHFFKDHGWAHAFGKANPSSEIKKNVSQSMYNSEDRARMEAEADYFGGIFGYLTGYNTLSVGAEFFDTLYTALKIPDETFGYPTRKDRMSIYDNSQEMLEKLIPVFKTANMLNLIRRYEQASMCYDHIIKTFPSREIYNNAGVALAQEAISLYTPEELQFVYPFGLDLDTRLDNAGRRSAGETKEAKRARLLKEAVQKFEKAIDIDEDYAAAYINLALASTLIEEHDMAIGYANKAIKKAKESKLLVANATIAQGIAHARKGDKKEAKQAFKAAEEGNALLAEANLDAVTNNVFAKLFKKKPVEEIEGEEENIDGIGIEALEFLYEDRKKFDRVFLRPKTEDQPATLLINAKEKEFDAAVVATRDLNFKVSLDGFLMTKKGYQGETVRGIKIGDTVEQIKEKYGDPTRMIGGIQGNYLFYEKTGIIFLVDAQQKLQSWMIYGRI